MGPLLLRAVVGGIRRFAASTSLSVFGSTDAGDARIRADGWTRTRVVPRAGTVPGTVPGDWRHGCS